MAKAKIIASLALVVSAGLAGGGGVAVAGEPAPTKVTIEALDFVYGYVVSPKKKCMGNRKVIAYRQVGKRGGGDDIKVANEWAEKDGNKYIYEIGNPSIVGKFYMKAPRIDGCKKGLSRSARQDQA